MQIKLRLFLSITIRLNLGFSVTWLKWLYSISIIRLIYEELLCSNQINSKAQRKYTGLLRLVREGKAQAANCMQGRKHIGLFGSAAQTAYDSIEPRIVEVVGILAHGFDERTTTDSVAALMKQACQ